MHKITYHIHNTLLDNGFNLHSINYTKAEQNIVHSIEYIDDKVAEGRYSYSMKPVPDLCTVRTNDLNELITFLQNKHILNQHEFDFNN